MNDAPPAKGVKPRPISGYVEWLPETRLVELRWMDHIRRVFEAYGFCSIETPSVEEISVLVSKGDDVDKEIYALNRLAGDGSNEPRVALHYDLTVPLARYVAQHLNELVFPFKRYQIQRAWRGERPQEGRFREFYQCDIDVIDRENLSLHFDAEIPAIICDILDGLDVGGYSLRINNRKILQGFYEALGVEDVVGAIRVVDKLDKIRGEGVTRMLVERVGLPPEIAAQCLALAEIRSGDVGFIDQVRALGVSSPLLDAGLDELKFVMEHLGHLRPGAVVADLSIARGFDYYTGTVYEVKMTDYPGYPSICSGGRYDNLVGGFLRERLPGIGMSIGLTRIFSKLVKEGKIPLGPKGPTQVLVAYLPGFDREAVLRTGAALRSRGVSVETYHEPHKLQNQLRYASRKGVPFVLFPGGEGRADEVKDMATGEQREVGPDWTPQGR